MEIILFKPEFIKEIRENAAPKGCHPIQGLLEIEGFFDAYKEAPLSVHQLIQVVGCGVLVSHAAAWLIVENHLSKN
jgi:hypothetical protein